MNKPALPQKIKNTQNIKLLRTDVFRHQSCLKTEIEQYIQKYCNVQINAQQCLINSACRAVWHLAQHGRNIWDDMRNIVTSSTSPQYFHC